MEPYLVHMYHQTIDWDHWEAKNFHIVGFDILLDTKLNAWLMEINANPSFNMFLERDLPNGEVEKTLSELDKYLKARVASEAIKIVTGVSFLLYHINRVTSINQPKKESLQIQWRPTLLSLSFHKSYQARKSQRNITFGMKFNASSTS
jgi:hypothetical protein